jgi:hypothetical protein
VGYFSEAATVTATTFIQQLIFRRRVSKSAGKEITTLIAIAINDQHRWLL